MCDRAHEQKYKCALEFGMDYLELWCDACSRELDLWCEQQAMEAQAIDSACGQGWLWHQLAPSAN